MYSTTIVLPVHNAERTLRPEVTRIMDLAEVLGRRLIVAIVDDGSHDGTYEAACDLAREFPQVRVLRQPYQRGLGGALEQVRNRLRIDYAIAHDGVTAINLDDLADALNNSERSVIPAPVTRQPASEGRGSRRVAAVMPAKLVAQQRIAGPRSFRWLRLDEPMTPRRSRAAKTTTPAASNLTLLPAASTATAFATPAPLTT